MGFFFFFFFFSPDLNIKKIMPKGQKCNFFSLYDIFKIISFQKVHQMCVCKGGSFLKFKIMI